MDTLNSSEVNGKIVFCARAQKKKERQMELQRKHEAEKMERYTRLVPLVVVSIIWNYFNSFPLGSRESTST